MKPHVHRCTEIYIEVSYGSSLPTVSRDLYGISTHLRKLSLICDYDNGPPKTLESMGEPRRIQALARLEEIHLYGYTIFDAVEHNMELFSRSIKLEQLEFGKFEVRFYDEAHIQSILPAFFTALSFPRTQADYKLSWMKLPPLKPGPRAYTVSSSELVLESGM